MITNEIGSRVFPFKTIALGAAAAVTLTACGGPIKMGTAAIIGDRRITTTKLDQTVVDWQKQFAKDPAAAQLQQQIQQQAQQQGQQFLTDPDSPPRNALVQLIDFQVWDETARQQHVVATRTQIDRIIAASGGQKVIDKRALAGVLPVSHARDLVRVFVIQNLLMERFGVVPNQQGQVDQQILQQAQQKLVNAHAQAIRTLNIKVNPRYGSFDSNSGLGPVNYGLSKADPGLNGVG